ncbi:hypothetical protein D9Q98_002502 [Chlorella vulgaris]|uniref:Uncharacterized protein n=1 Tax=Chlorella vulgaris TaxID=3077 RepID=A0A9D4YZS2_CHLVU|nr:hypothetical protein D9Q98_002502 [Chlorella vulgaris]
MGDAVAPQPRIHRLDEAVVNRIAAVEVIQAEAGQRLEGDVGEQPGLDSSRLPAPPRDTTAGQQPPACCTG